MKIRDFLWDLFPYFYYKYDTYKNSTGEGLLHRYIKSLGEEIDEEVMGFLNENSNKYFLNNIEALKVDDNLIEYLSSVLGNPPSIFDNIEYRKLLQYIVPIYKIKGSLLSYKLFLNLLGFGVKIIEYEPSKRTEDISSTENLYDMSNIYDDYIIYDTFLSDSGNELNCLSCSDYILILNQIGPHQLTDVLISRIKQVIHLIEPINARLKHIILALPDFVDEGRLCIKQDILIKKIKSFKYDQEARLYDNNLNYDESELESMIIFNRDCNGTSQLQGIGYWDINGNNIIQ
jgi:hypothetical protein